LRKILARYDKIEEYMLVGSLVFTVTLVFIQVIMRYLFNNSLSWSEELTRYIFIWQIWLGASLGLRDKKHIKVELLHDFLSTRWGAILDIFANLIWMASCVFFVYSGTMLIFDLIENESLSTALSIPLWTVYLALPVSSFVMVIRQMLQISDDITVVRCGKGE